MTQGTRYIGATKPQYNQRPYTKQKALRQPEQNQWYTVSIARTRGILSKPFHGRANKHPSISKNDKDLRQKDWFSESTEKYEVKYKNASYVSKTNAFLTSM